MLPIGARCRRHAGVVNRADSYPLFGPADLSILGITTVVLGPALFRAGYPYYKDRHQPEPSPPLLLACAPGIGAGYLGFHTYAALDLLGLRFDAYELARYENVHSMALPESREMLIRRLLGRGSNRSTEEPVDLPGCCVHDTGESCTGAQRPNKGDRPCQR